MDAQQRLPRRDRIPVFHEPLEDLPLVVRADPELALVGGTEFHRRLVDVGGARGNLVAQLVRAHPHLTACVFDLPEMADPFAEHVRTLVPDGQVTFRAGDFFADPLPEGDVLILGHVLHNWSPEERQLLIGKAFAAVRPNGWLLVYDAMLDEEPTDLARILVSINMLLVTSGGSEYPVSARSTFNVPFRNCSRLYADHFVAAGSVVSYSRI